MELRNAHVLLTGASGGIGRALAIALADRGAHLRLTGRNRAVLRELADQVGGSVVAADLSDRDDVQRLLAEVGTVDVLIANAGIPASGLLSEYSVDQIDRALDVNLRVPIIMAKALGEQMAARKAELVAEKEASGLPDATLAAIDER